MRYLGPKCKVGQFGKKIEEESLDRVERVTIRATLQNAFIEEFGLVNITDVEAFLQPYLQDCEIAGTYCDKIGICQVRKALCDACDYVKCGGCVHIKDRTALMAIGFCGRCKAFRASEGKDGCYIFDLFQKETCFSLIRIPFDSSNQKCPYERSYCTGYQWPPDVIELRDVLYQGKPTRVQIQRPAPYRCQRGTKDVLCPLLHIQNVQDWHNSPATIRLKMACRNALAAKPECTPKLAEGYVVKEDFLKKLRQRTATRAKKAKQDLRKTKPVDYVAFAYSEYLLNQATTFVFARFPDTARTELIGIYPAEYKKYLECILAHEHREPRPRRMSDDTFWTYAFDYALRHRDISVAPPVIFAGVLAVANAYRRPMYLTSEINEMVDLVMRPSSAEELLKVAEGLQEWLPFLDHGGARMEELRRRTDDLVALLQTRKGERWERTTTESPLRRNGMPKDISKQEERTLWASFRQIRQSDNDSNGAYENWDELVERILFFNEVVLPTEPTQAQSQNHSQNRNMPPAQIVCDADGEPDASAITHIGIDVESLAAYLDNGLLSGALNASILWRPDPEEQWRGWIKYCQEYRA